MKKEIMVTGNYAHLKQEQVIELYLCQMFLLMI
jgi:hypothetical protein